jgi:DNA-binding transcriptional MerR regulator
MAAPKRELFRSADVCEMAQVQPYVLRSWEAEFPGLGQEPAGGGPRVYRRADVEFVLRIKQLVFGEGLTLAGARRRLGESQTEGAPVAAVAVEEALDKAARERLRSVKRGLRSILELLGDGGTKAPQELTLVPQSAPRASRASRAEAKKTPTPSKRRRASA